MHAKLTRDRKKLFTSRMQQTIQTLEKHNQLLRSRLNSLMYTGIGRSASGNHLVAIKPEEVNHIPPPLNSLPLAGYAAHPVALGHTNIALSTEYTRAPSMTNIAAALPQSYNKFGLMTPNGWVGPMFPRTWPYEFNQGIPTIQSQTAYHPSPLSTMTSTTSTNPGTSSQSPQS